jgi:hypothetical protein
VQPQAHLLADSAYPTDALTRNVNGHPNSDIDSSQPKAYHNQGLLEPWPENDGYTELREKQ